VCPCAEALAAVGESNADNWVVMQKGLPLLIAMLQAPDLRQAEAAVCDARCAGFPCHVTL